MHRKKEIDVGTLLGIVSQMLAQNQGRLDEVDGGAGVGSHGERMARAFQTASEAAGRTSSGDAGDQLAAAAEAMRRQGRGRAAGFYANGLEDAAQQFRGQSGVSLGSLLPFLQSFLGGVQRDNPAQPGDGTMIDALLPAVQAYMEAKQRGLDDKQAATEALGSAVTGARGTGGRRFSGSGGRNSGYGDVDPGAASATNILGGIVQALLPGVLGALAQGQGGGGGFLQSQPRPNSPGYEQPDPVPGGIGGLGGIMEELLNQGQARNATGFEGREGLGPLEVARERPKESWWPFG